MYFWQRLQTCVAAAELFTLITLLLMAAGCQSGCRSLQAQMWPHDFWERGGGGVWVRRSEKQINEGSLEKVAVHSSFSRVEGLVCV